jgi:hypothetical protein
MLLFKKIGQANIKKKLIEPILDFIFLNIIGRIQWEWLTAKIKGRPYTLTLNDFISITNCWKEMNFITLTRRNSHLSTYLIQIGHFLVTGRLNCYYTHALFNKGTTAIEAIGKGVVYSKPEDVLNCDGAALLLPKGIGMFEWQRILSEAERHAIENTPYDTFFSLSSDNELSCIELIYDALKEVDGADKKWPKFFKLVEEKKNVTPQMIYDCGDFIVFMEVGRRRKYASKLR